MDGIQILTYAPPQQISISSLTSGSVVTFTSPPNTTPTQSTVQYVLPTVPSTITANPVVINIPVAQGASLSDPPIPSTIGSVVSGSLAPNLTMQNVNLPYYIPYSFLSSLQKQDPFTVSTLNANVINVSTVNAVSSFVGTSYTISSFNQNVLTDYLEATEAYVYDKLTLDNQVLTANATDLLLNGIPIATTSNISSIADWAYDPAVSTIQANGNDLTNVRFANFSSIIADGLTVVKLTTLFSTTIEVFESTITSETQKLTVSSITGGDGFFDVLTAGSFINPASSTINCQFLNVSSNANMLNATFSNAPTFNQGGTFNGTRPNFNTGFVTSGANNFNFTNIDNASNINGNVITIAPQNNLNINTSNAVATVVDRGADVGGSAVIGLTARFGAGSQINLNANSASVFSPTPASAINLNAQGNVSYLSGIPFGGAVNITAQAGLSGTGTSVAGGGGINLTAYSYGALAPGTIKESAGSILSYSGLTVPSVGVLGSGFYSALNCLSLTAGATPATTSFPGVVYLRGDNGTKVVNGFFTDTITATGNSVLPTITTNGLTAPVGSNLAFFATSQNIQFNSATVGFNAHVAGAFSVSTITDVATINGVAFPQPSGAGVWASTATTALNMAGFNINNIGSLYLSNGTNIDGVYPNQLNFNASNSYFLGNLRFFGSGRTLDIADNIIQNVSYIYGNASGFLNINAVNGMVIENNQGAEMRLNTNGSMELKCLSTQQLTINQTSGSDFVLFNNGDARMNAKRDAFMGGDRDALITAQQNAIIRSQVNIIHESITGYINLVAGTGGSNTIYLTGANTEVRGNMGFTPSNAYINNLGHIYGSQTAPGSGLAIDYMYGMFFNSPGKNASIFIDAGNLNMQNYNTGINIGNYNAFGTGNMNITSQNNDVYISAPTRNIYLNATTGVAMNSGGAQIAIAGDNNIYFTGNGGGGTTRYANFQDTNVAFNTGTPGTLGIYMNGNNILNVGNLTRNLGSAVVRTPVIQYGTVGVSGNSGSIVVNIPNAYTSATSYIALVSMEDTIPAEMSVVRISASRIEIYWNSGGGGAHTLAWSCQGE
jgi:hypothetical protein